MKTDGFKIEFWFMIAVFVIFPSIYVMMVERPPSELSFMMDYRVPPHARVILPLPENDPFDAEKARIGKKVWFGAAECERCHRLANTRPEACFASTDTNCRTCHVPPLRGSGGDGQPIAELSSDRKSERNALSVWNSRYNVGYGWDGREVDLGAFIASHLNDPTLYDPLTRAAVLRKLNADAQIKAAWAKSGEEKVTLEETAEVLGEFVKTLVARNSRFDRYLRGEKEILTPLEKQGYKTFKARGCIVCHNGVNVGGNSFKIFGVYKLHKLKDTLGWYTLLGSTYEDENLREKDRGIYRLTQLPQDSYRFRVASLRNVELNRPYFTQGQVWELSEAIRTMGRVQLGVELREEEVRAIEAFLGTLSGRIPVINPPFSEEKQ